MGSINKKPKTPPVQPLAPLPPPPSVSVGETPSSGQQQTATTRRENLLRRSRGRLGTVVSGFRGFLNPAKDSERKTLLGE